MKAALLAACMAALSCVAAAQEPVAGIAPEVWAPPLPPGAVPVAIAPDQLDDTDAPAVRDVAQHWVSPSIWSGRVAVNEPPRQDRLTVLLVRSAPANTPAAKYNCGCNEIPGYNTIICDSAFIRRWTRSIDPAADIAATADPTIRAILTGAQDQFRRFLLDWLIGHEVGHFILKHDAASLAGNWVDDHGRSIGSDEERQADEFYISKLQNTHTRQFFAWLGLSNVITSLYAQLIGEQHGGDDLRQYGVTEGIDPVFSGRVPVEVHYWPGSHPPLLSRALNLAGVVLSIYPQMVDTTPYFGLVSRAVKLVPVRDKAPSCPIAPAAPTEAELSSLAEQVAFLATADVPGERRRAALAQLGGAAAALPDTQAQERWSVTRDILAIAVDGAWPAPGAVAALQERIARLDDPARRVAGLRFLAVQVRLRPATDQKGLAASLADSARPAEGQEAAVLAALSVLEAVAGFAGDPPQAAIEAEEHALERLAADDVGTTAQARALQLLEARLGRQLGGAAMLRRTPSAAVGQVFDELIGFSSVVGALAQEIVARGKALAYLQSFPDAKGWRPALIENEWELARVLMRVGQSGPAVGHYRAAADRLDALAAQLPAEERADVLGRRMSALNDLGWALTIDRQFDRAVDTLEQVKAWRGARLPAWDPATCRAGDTEAVEFATVRQNLADARLGRGQLGEARALARSARECRAAMGQPFKAAESEKTEALAAHALGDDAAAVPKLTHYVTVFGDALDNRAFLDLDPYLGGGVVAGQYVKVRDLLPPRPPPFR